MSTLEIITKYHDALIRGIIVTLRLCLFIWTNGVVMGGLLGFVSERHSIVRYITRLLSFLLSGIPVLVLLFWLHYPAQSLLGIVVDPFWTTVLCLSVVNIITVAQIVCPVLQQFPQHYITAAKVCGMPPFSIITKIQMPLLMRQIIPAILMSQVVMLQTTLFASLISVDEIFRVAQQINAEVYRPIQVYSALGLFFLLVCLPINGLAIWLQRHFTVNFSES